MQKLIVIPTFINDQHFFYLNDTSDLLTSLTSYYGTHSSSTVGITGTSSGSNSNASGEDYLCYAFAPVAGYSAFGTYEGNGSATDGPFVNLNFAPAFLLVKRTDSTGNWILVDQTRVKTRLFTLTKPFLSPLRHLPGLILFLTASRFAAVSLL